MTAAYLDARQLFVNLGGVWTDITADAVSSYRVSWGMGGAEVLDRVATVGTLTFDLNNVTRKYSPGSDSASPYWVKGAPVKLVLTFDSGTYTRFYGFIDEIKIQSGTWGTRRVNVRCVDWMQIASTYPLVLPQSYTNQRADQGVTLIVNQMPIQPQARQFATTNDTFSQIFDTIKVKGKALAEFAKLTLSEFGYLYLRKDRANGEMLVVEGRHDRDSTAQQGAIPVSMDNSGRLLMEDGSYLLLEDGGKIVLDETTTYDFDNTMQALDVLYGHSFSNYVSVRTYPREVGSSVEVLFKLNSPISLIAGETKSKIRGSYVDPRGGGTQINGSTMITPVATTDYKMFQNSNGTGTDLTANLAVIADYSTAEVIYTLTNTGGTAGYVTFLQARGFPVYIYNPIEQYVQDDASILANGYKELNVDQKYSPSLLPNSGLAAVLLAQEKDAKTDIQKLHFLGNTSYEHMASALSLDVGSLIKIVENQTAQNASYFIQSVTMEIQLNGMVYTTWALRPALSLSSQYWTLGDTGFSELGVTTFVGF